MKYNDQFTGYSNRTVVTMTTSDDDDDDNDGIKYE